MSEPVNYVPATTRAVITQFGGELSVQLGRQRVAVSSHELPGEVEWRVDMLNWYAERLAFNAVALAPQARNAMLSYARAVLVSESGLHPMEAAAVVASSSQVLERLGFPSMSGSAEAIMHVDERLDRAWDALQRRYSRILAACR